MDLSIHSVKVVSVFREAGFTKLSILDSLNRVTEINLFGAWGLPVKLRDSDNRCPILPHDFEV